MSRVAFSLGFSSMEKSLSVDAVKYRATVENDSGEVDHVTMSADRAAKAKVVQLCVGARSHLGRY